MNQSAATSGNDPVSWSMWMSTRSPRSPRILVEEWAYIRPWRSENHRHIAYDRFIHFYNHHRSHGALRWATPLATLSSLAQDNLPAEHT